MFRRSSLFGWAIAATLIVAPAVHAQKFVRQNGVTALPAPILLDTTGMFQDRYALPPNYAAYKATNALLGLKAAYEKAQKAGAAAPSQEQIAAGLENLSFEGVGGTVKMALGKGHQAVMDNAIGTVRSSGGEMRIVDVKRYPAEQVNPPEGMKSEAWIKAGLKK